MQKEKEKQIQIYYEEQKRLENYYKKIEYNINTQYNNYSNKSKLIEENQKEYLDKVRQIKEEFERKMNQLNYEAE